MAFIGPQRKMGRAMEIGKVWDFCGTEGGNLEYCLNIKGKSCP
jgi:hypothetical protein